MAYRASTRLALVWLAEQSDEDWAKVTALMDGFVAQSMAELVARLSESESCDARTADALVETSVSLRERVRTLVDAESESNSLARLALQGVARTREGDYSPDQTDLASSRLVELARCPAVSALGGAARLVQSNEKNFLTARVVTDVRYVFPDDLDGGIADAGPIDPTRSVVMVHQLLLTFDEDGQRRKVNVSMDSADVGFMISLLDRALRKQAGLTEVVADHVIPGAGEHV